MECPYTMAIASQTGINFAQTFKDFELLISDNGSTDRTEDRAYAANDQRILLPS